MLILRALLFSPSVLWRFLLMLPVVLVGMAAIYILLFIVTLIFSAISPILVIIPLILIGFGSTSGIFLMTATRLGLQAKGVKPKNGYGGVIGNSIGYGMFEGLLIILIAGGFAFAASFVVDSPVLDGILSLQEIDAEAALEENPTLSLALVAMYLLLIACVRAFVLPALTAASVGRDPSGHRHTPFNGIGANFISLLIIVIVSPIVIFCIRPLFAFGANLIGQGDAITDTFERTGQFTELQDWISGIDANTLFLLGIVTIIFSWMQCIQAAGGVLGYLQREERQKSNAADQVAFNHQASAVDAGALWRDRL